MALFLILLLSLTTPHQLRGEIQETPGLSANFLERNGYMSGSSIAEKTTNELFLPNVITSINIDYVNNALVVQFRRLGQLAKGDMSDPIILDKNFMRFGRGAGDSSLMRFGKRQFEFFEANPEVQEETNENSARDSRGDNFMRFGRSNGNRMRFGRAASTTDSSENIITQTSQHSPQTDPSLYFDSIRNNFRSGREPDESVLNFDRGDQDFIRFTRNNGRMRLGRSDSFMRLGRAPIAKKLIESQLNVEPYVPRLNRNDKNFMRYGKLDQNFMRFGKRHNHLEDQDTEHKKSNLNHIDNYFDNWARRRNRQ